MMRPHYLSDTLSNERQNAIVSLVDEYGAREVWLFGSAVDQHRAHDPNDVDVAFVGVPGRAKDLLAKALFQRFPRCRVDDLLSYTWGSLLRECRPPLHFVLSDDSDDLRGHPISQAIRRGTCLWRAR